jgi:hypothetical protein
MNQIIEASDEARQVGGQPPTIVANIIKDRGLSPFQENDVNRMHGKLLDEDQKESP